MGETNYALFIRSGVVAFCLYFSIVFFIIFNFSVLFKKKYIPRTNTILEQSIAVSFTAPEVKKADNKNSGTPLEGLGIREMFSKIPDSIAPLPEGDDRSEHAKNTKDKTEKDKFKSIQEQLEQMNTNLNAMGNRKLDVESQSISPEFADGEYNEWFGKIYDIIYQNWHANYYKDAAVTAILRITNTGSLSYRIVKFSNIEDYNTSVITLLESLKQRQLPPYPKGKSVDIEVNFKLR